MIKRLAIATLCAAALASSGCQTISGANPNLDNQDVRLTILHTADWHSRLVPYAFTPGLTDQSLGLDPNLSLLGIGGVERLAYLIGRERGRSARVIWLDSGDCFQGAPIFNIYHGEPEIRTQSEIGLDAAVIGNHEFDVGAQNLANQESKWNGYPLLAANYLFNDPSKPWTAQMNALVQPYTVLNIQGLRVGVIGMANLDTLYSIVQQGNSLGITPLDPVQTTQYYVNIIRPFVDFTVVVSHLGLSQDENLARNVRGLDVILGGHLHIVLPSPEQIADPDGRNVLIVDSGAFLKYLGRLDLVLRKNTADPLDAAKNGFDVASYKFQVFPIDKRVDDEIQNTATPDDSQKKGIDLYGRVQYIMEPYLEGLADKLDLTRTVGCSIDPDIKRYGTQNGDSQMGNITAEAMQLEPRVLADFGATNSLGIRDDLRGVQLDPNNPQDDGRICRSPIDNSVDYSVDQEQLFNVLPFENTITTMYLSGREVQELMDYNAERSAGRGCQTQLQISGATMTMVCGGDQHGDFPHTDNIEIGGIPLQLNGTYKLATNDYIAAGGSGFQILQHNTTQQNTFISMRDAVIEYLKTIGTVPCTNDPSDAYPNCPAGFDHVGVEDGRIVSQP